MPRRLRLRFGDNEIEVEGDPAFIKAQLADFFSRIGLQVIPSRDLPKAIATAAEKHKVPSPSESLREKKPKTGTERLLVLGRYLEAYRSAVDFSPSDVNKLAAEAKITKIEPIYFTRAVKQGLLRTTGKRRYSLTLSGEDVVNAMPSEDRSGR